MFEKLISFGFDVAIRNHAGAILTTDFPEVAAELEEALLNVKIPVEGPVRGTSLEPGEVAT